jgi:hypothetical protein
VAATWLIYLVPDACLRRTANALRGLATSQLARLGVENKATRFCWLPYPCRPSVRRSHSLRNAVKVKSLVTLRLRSLAFAFRPRSASEKGDNRLHGDKPLPKGQEKTNLNNGVFDLNRKYIIINPVI